MLLRVINRDFQQKKISCIFPIFLLFIWLKKYGIESLEGKCGTYGMGLIDHSKYYYSGHIFFAKIKYVIVEILMNVLIWFVFVRRVVFNT